LTVAAVVERDGRFLIVEEYAAGRPVLSQPGGHIESGESPERAVERETLEESGCTVRCEDLIGVYLWTQPRTRHQYLRIAYRATYVDVDETLPLDDGVIRRRWLTLDQLKSRRAMLRSPTVLQCVRDHVNGQSVALPVPRNLVSLERHLDEVLAVASHV
jgi:ADP-ribose pyrophosphatase YjhB (NUDIX family)